MVETTFKQPKALSDRKPKTIHQTMRQVDYLPIIIPLFFKKKTTEIYTL